MWGALKSTFGNVWSLLGILVGALSLVNLGVTYFSVGLDPILGGIVDTYRAVFHTAFDYLFFWVPMILPEFRFPDWVKDVTAFYAVFCAAAMRAHMHLSGSDYFKEKRSRLLADGLLWPLGLFRLITNIRENFVDTNAPRWMRLISDTHLWKTIFWPIILNLITVPLVAFLFVMVSSGMPN